MSINFQSQISKQLRSSQIYVFLADLAQPEPLLKPNLDFLPRFGLTSTYEDIRS